MGSVVRAARADSNTSMGRALGSGVSRPFDCSHWNLCMLRVSRCGACTSTYTKSIQMTKIQSYIHPKNHHNRCHHHQPTAGSRNRRCSIQTDQSCRLILQIRIPPSNRTPIFGHSSSLGSSNIRVGPATRGQRRRMGESYRSSYSQRRSWRKMNMYYRMQCSCQGSEGSYSTRMHIQPATLPTTLPAQLQSMVFSF